MAIHEYVLSYVEALNNEAFMRHPHASAEEVLMEGSVLLRACCGPDRDAYHGIAERLLFWMGALPDDLSMGSLKTTMVEHAWRVYAETRCTTVCVGYA